MPWFAPVTIATWVTESRLLARTPAANDSLGRVTGDAAAVFQAQRGRLFGLAYRLLGSAPDAEDALQDAFLRWDAADWEAVSEPAPGSRTCSAISPPGGWRRRRPR
jgi:hypothetical protein